VPQELLQICALLLRDMDGKSLARSNSASRAVSDLRAVTT
jgi:hypothetical protein